MLFCNIQYLAWSDPDEQKSHRGEPCTELRENGAEFEAPEREARPGVRLALV